MLPRPAGCWAGACTAADVTKLPNEPGNELKLQLKVGEKIKWVKEMTNRASESPHARTSAHLAMPLSPFCGQDTPPAGNCSAEASHAALGLVHNGEINV